MGKKLDIFGGPAAVTKVNYFIILTQLGNVDIMSASGSKTYAASTISKDMAQT